MNILDIIFQIQMLKKLLINLFIFFLIFWFGISIIRTIYNLSKLTKDIQILNLSEEQKKEATYGQVYSFCKFAEKKTRKNSNILFLSTSGKGFLFCRYHLYPRKLFHITDPKDLKSQIQNGKFNYILIFQDKELLEGSESAKWNLEDYKFDILYDKEINTGSGLIIL